MSQAELKKALARKCDPLYPNKQKAAEHVNNKVNIFIEDAEKDMLKAKQEDIVVRDYKVTTDEKRETK